MSRHKVPNLFRPNPQIIAPCAYDRKLAARLAAQYTQDCIDRLVYWMNQDEEPQVALAATRELLDRAYGKPRELREEDPRDARSPLRVTVEFVRPTLSQDPPALNELENITPQHTT